MKYTVHGFQQEAIMKLGLTHDECLVLRWFVDFLENGMREHIVDGIVYYWVNYQTVINDLAVLRLKKQRVAILFKNLVKAGVLKHFHLKEGGSYSFYTTGDAYTSLIYDPMQSIADPSILKYIPLHTKIDTPSIEKDVPLYTKISNKDSSIKDSSIKKQKKTLQPNLLFEEFFSIYPKNDDKIPAQKNYEKAIKSKEVTHEEIMISARAYALQVQLNKTETKFIKKANNWLREGLWTNTYGSTTTTTSSTNAYDALIAKIKSVMDQNGNFEHNASPCNIYNIEKFISSDDSVVKVYYTDTRGITDFKNFTIEKITKIGAYC